MQEVNQHMQRLHDMIRESRQYEAHRSGIGRALIDWNDQRGPVSVRGEGWLVFRLFWHYNTIKRVGDLHATSPAEKRLITRIRFAVQSLEVFMIDPVAQIFRGINQ